MTGPVWVALGTAGVGPFKGLRFEGGGYGDDDDDGPMWPWILGMVLALMLLVLVLVALGLGWIKTDHKRFWVDRPGDIVAGQPTEVLEVWHNKIHSGKHGPGAYDLFLVTLDCDNDHCWEERHPVKALDFRKFGDGDKIHWRGADADSTVLEHRYRWDDGLWPDGYRFALLVEQCLAGRPCVRDYVPVGFGLWYHSHAGDVVTFKGKPGKVVS